MKPMRDLAPCLVGRGTVTNVRDMLRVMETTAFCEYRYLVHGDLLHEGQATLVKLMADPESSTLIVNECLFLNVASFRYIDFEQNETGVWKFALHGDGSTLEVTALPEPANADAMGPRLLFEEAPDDVDMLIALNEDDEEE